MSELPSGALSGQSWPPPICELFRVVQKVSTSLCQKCHLRHFLVNPGPLAFLSFSRSSNKCRFLFAGVSFETLFGQSWPPPIFEHLMLFSLLRGAPHVTHRRPTDPLVYDENYARGP